MVRRRSATWDVALHVPHSTARHRNELHPCERTLTHTVGCTISNTAVRFMVLFWPFTGRSSQNFPIAFTSRLFHGMPGSEIVVNFGRFGAGFMRDTVVSSSRLCRQMVFVQCELCNMQPLTSIRAMNLSCFDSNFRHFSDFQI